MRYAVALLTFCWIIGGRAINSSPQSSPQTASDYRVAYERWCRAIDSNPVLGEPFWVSANSGPSELRSAVGDLLAIGPNLTPFLAKEMRREKDHLRLYQLVLLLNRVSGINLYYGSGKENYYAAMPRFRDRFIEDWDSGRFLNATASLQATWMYSDDPGSRKAIDPKRLTPIIRYGVFAIPFILESLEKHDSAELFAAFLIIIGESELYAYYLEKPADFLPERGQKLSYMKTWAGKNDRKIDKLESLHQQIKALTSL
ncbi:MAG: hypothetical protein V7641_4723 [Blastocatellia bacterium]